MDDLQHNLHHQYVHPMAGCHDRIVWLTLYTPTQYLNWAGRDHILPFNKGRCNIAHQKMEKTLTYSMTNSWINVKYNQNEFMTCIEKLPIKRNQFP